jgi:hypothetical protein
MVALHTGIAIVIAVGLIIALKVDPVISLLLASLYLGLAAGVGFTGTMGRSPRASARSWRKSGCSSGSVS